MYPYISIFTYKFPTYLFCALIGILLSFSLALFRSKSAKFNVSLKEIIYVLISILVGAILGAKTFQIIALLFQNGIDALLKIIIESKGIIKGVGVFYGGLLGGFTSAFCYIKISKLNFNEVMDIITPSVPLFHFWGRLGCFFAGCCYGIESDSFFCVNGKYPVQLFEAGYNLFILTLLLMATHKKYKKGCILPLYLILYSIGRFFLEFFRGDNSYFPFFYFSIAQYISILILIVVIFKLKNKNQIIEKLGEKNEKNFL